MSKRRALLSVWDKTGIVELARGLVALDIELLSTGGTEKALRDADIPVRSVSDITGFPECLDGRVKTLHPNVHAGILAMRGNPDHLRQIQELGIEPIDFVIINLYPFRATIEKQGVTFEEAIENIDIGGPTMLRAAAKNAQDVAVIVDPKDYDAVLSDLERTGEVSMDLKSLLQYKVFAHTAQYDALIAEYLRPKAGVEALAPTLTIPLEKTQAMRYGENPHQKAAFYRDLLAAPGSLTQAVQLHGKELSYNNISDADGALELLREFDSGAVIAVKHANPCGVGLGATSLEAYNKAYESDPVSIFGGIVVSNLVIDEATAEAMNQTFLEIIIAPEYTMEALKVLMRKKNLRILKLDTRMHPPQGTLTMKKIYGGMLVQDYNDQLLLETPWTVVTKAQPTAQQIEDMMLAWRIVKHVKSNGIAIAKDGQSLGIGPGQVNRIWATQMALERSGERVHGASLASDAFFPFDDCVRAATAAGITSIIQPGGSVHDQQSILAADEAGIVMVFTGIRHFKH